VFESFSFNMDSRSSEVVGGTSQEPEPNYPG
jgi:hypothetical protein